MRLGLFLLISLSLLQNLAWAKKAAKGQSDYGTDTNPITIFNQDEFDDASGVHVKFEEICSNRDHPTCVDDSDPNNPVTISVHDFIYQLSLPGTSANVVGSVSLSGTGPVGAFATTPLVGPLECTPNPGGTPPYQAPCNDASEPPTACVLQSAYAFTESVVGTTYTATFPFDPADEGCNPTATFAAGGGITLFIELDTAVVTTPPTLMISAGPPSFSLDPDPATKTVTAGSSATFTIAVNPTFGFDNDVTLACPDLSSLKMTCSFNPTKANPSTPSILTVTTVASTTVTGSVVPSAKRFPFLAELFLCGAFVIGGLDLRRRRYLWLAVVLILTTVGLVSCGGNSGPMTHQVLGTPTGLHDVTVTGTGPSGSQTTHVTVDVQ